ncbi:MAG: hypothetical protein ACKO7B_04695 [Flavobacteriales bacterium]
MQHTNRRKKSTLRKPIQWPVSSEPTLIVIEVDGKSSCCYSIHRETYVRNPETCECLRMDEWHNVSLWPIFTALEEDENQEYVLVFPPLPSHWQTFDVWEMKGSKPLYRGGINRNKDGVYIIR